MTRRLDRNCQVTQNTIPKCNAGQPILQSNLAGSSTAGAGGALRQLLSGGRFAAFYSSPYSEAKGSLGHRLVTKAAWGIGVPRHWIPDRISQGKQEMTSGKVYRVGSLGKTLDAFWELAPGP